MTFSTTCIRTALKRLQTFAGPCEHGNEPSDSTKGEEFLDQLSDN